MAYVSDKLKNSFLREDPSHRKLSDGLVRLVVLRPPETRLHVDVVSGTRLRDKARVSDTASNIIGRQDSVLSSSSIEQASRALLPSLTEATPALSTARKSSTGSSQPSKLVTRKRRGISRREQCRTNQARYRFRQRNRQLELEESVRQLRQEVSHLKRGYERARPGGSSKLSPWTIVAEVFRLMEESTRSSWNRLESVDTTEHAGTRSTFLLRKHISPGISMGGFCGVDALVEQLRHHTMSFSEPELQLQRIESTAPGVMTATARLSVTVTEVTLRRVFPDLLKRKRQGPEDHAVLRECLLGQRLHLCCSMIFFFDEETDQVNRLEIDMDVVPSLLLVLGNANGVASALRMQLIYST